MSRPVQSRDLMAREIYSPFSVKGSWSEAVHNSLARITT